MIVIDIVLISLAAIFEGAGFTAIKRAVNKYRRKINSLQLVQCENWRRFLRRQRAAQCFRSIPMKKSRLSGGAHFANARAHAQRSHRMLIRRM
jgi:hypothetical protein